MQKINNDPPYGLNSIADAGAVVLETDGSLTVVKELEIPEAATMQHVKKPKSFTA